MFETTPDRSRLHDADEFVPEMNGGVAIKKVKASCMIPATLPMLLLES
jgi:hypothetical protein